jgi:hypothetical protein
MIYGLGFRVSGFEFTVNCFKYKVSGGQVFGFMLLGLG